MSDISNLEIRNLILTFEKFAKADWRKEYMFGVKRSEIKLLLRVEDLSHESEHGVTVSEISKSLMVTSPTVTQMVKCLSQNGYIERCVDQLDRRVANIKLTAKGSHIVEQVRKRRTVLFTGFIESLGREKTAQLISLLEEAYDYFDIATKGE